MSLSKSLLWIVNIAIAVVALAATAQIYYSVALLVSEAWQIEIPEKDRTGADGYTGALGLSEMDIEYRYKSHDGQVLLDTYFLAFDHIEVFNGNVEVDFFLNERRNYLNPPRAFDATNDLYDTQETSLTRLLVPVERWELRWVLILRVLIYMVLIAAALFILFGLRRFIIRAIENEFFDRTNYLLLLRIGLTLFGYAILHLAGYTYLEWLINERVGQSLTGLQTILFNYEFKWEFSASGLLLVLISLAFKQGAVLKKEHELTI